MDRLRLLLETTKAIPENQFNMLYFFSSRFDNIKQDIKSLKTGCGTTGCIAGWACCHPKFVGLRKILANNCYGIYHLTEINKCLAKYFNISYSEADDLFFDLDATKEESIKKIERLLCVNSMSST